MNISQNDIRFHKNIRQTDKTIGHTGRKQPVHTYNVAIFSKLIRCANKRTQKSTFKKIQDKQIKRPKRKKLPKNWTRSTGESPERFGRTKPLRAHHQQQPEKKRKENRKRLIERLAQKSNRHTKKQWTNGSNVSLPPALFCSKTFGLRGTHQQQDVGH